MAPLPRILCLHGAGSSGSIFWVQTRKIRQALKNEFDFVFLDAPFPSAAGPGMFPVYHESGPFFRWHCDRSSADYFDITEAEVKQEQEAVRQLLLSRLHDNGGNSDVASFVGIMAFSQGARVATGLLLHLLEAEGLRLLPKLQFAVICCGTYPPLIVHDAPSPEKELGQKELVGGEKRITATDGKKVTIASLHLHGSRDPWRPESERLQEECFDKSTSTVITFSGSHQIPAQDGDVAEVVQAMRQLALKA
jgi:predicted esterase